MQSLDLSVIIPVYNKWNLTKDCLHSLFATTQATNYEVIVVDNGSEDATKTELESLGQTLFGNHFQAIHLATNHNFGPACNLGAQVATAPYLFFLNNDTRLTPAWDAPLINTLVNRDKVAGVGPLLLYPNETVQHLGIVFSCNRPQHLYRFFPVNHPVVQTQRPLQALTAAALMLRRSDFLDQGGFYPDYANGFEDVDLCLHLGRSGRKFFCIAKSHIYHLESQTPGRSNNEEKNSKLLYARCADMYQVDLHIQGLRDGFLPIVTDTLELCLTLKQDTSANLLEKAKGQSIDVWEKLLEMNPYWLDGHEYLAAQSLDQGEYEKAITQYATITSWFPQKQHYTKLLSLEPLCPGFAPNIFSTARKRLAEIAHKTKDLTFIKRHLRSRQVMQDKYLTKLYTDMGAAILATLKNG
ncbi:MAG: glycosyltransferase [Desulfovibrionaceae bacterium]|nr:glycosyltransferase [Desulfovibrionaceae bacterium]